MNVQFEMDISEGESSRVLDSVVVRVDPYKSYKGENLIEAVNVYLDAQENKEVIMEQNDKTAMNLEEYLYCVECGEDNLSFEANYGGFYKWKCNNCGHTFQRKAPQKD
ncbi:hypothetical protein PP175_28770 (plasmid) [Aneurinibacillus sp. Ricciae_BoGa-3]|uniref:hypothetical protein n=1 Tax=Aneurinibacillus sp. Ricciae_BoGa-3 TaxID=3022697 RepID=UPI00234107E1|nr:hypothetical protein [Aneurinibacillus sp. Ricciae_BoGa-3]WCK57184.1 hypothetical protein PP175_28770 [Aneurinibacillus sp. Ricciae_BoGa-3]